MAGKDVLTTRIGDQVKVEVREPGDSGRTIADYGNVAPKEDGTYGWHVASGASGESLDEERAINACARAIRGHVRAGRAAMELPDLEIFQSPEPKVLVHIALAGMVPGNVGSIITGPGERDLVLVMRQQHSDAWLAMHQATWDSMVEDDIERMTDFICGYVVS